MSATPIADAILYMQATERAYLDAPSDDHNASLAALKAAKTV